MSLESHKNYYMFISALYSKDTSRTKVFFRVHERNFGPLLYHAIRFPYPCILGSHPHGLIASFVAFD